MNVQVNPANMALAMYETAVVSHRRQDWREASHALAKALRHALASSVAHEPLRIAPPVQAAPKPVKAPKAKVVKATGYVMTAESLAKALRLAGRVIYAKSRVPILLYARLTGRGNVLQITTTDLDRELTILVEAPGVGQWESVVPHKALLSTLASGRGPVSIVGADNGIQQQGETKTKLTKLAISGAVSAIIPGRHGEDFPIMADPRDPATVAVQAADLASMLAFTAPAISKEETRYYLNGVYIHTTTETDDGGACKLNLAATDGHRLNLARADYAGPDFKGVIIPRETAKDMAAILTAGQAATLQVGATHCRLTAGPVTLTSKLIDGSFPDYRRVIPRSNHDLLTLDGGELAAAVKQVSAVSDSKAKPVRLTMAPDGFAVSCKSMAGAESSAAAAASWSGPEVSTGFAAQYILEAVQVMGAGPLTFAMGCEPVGEATPPTGWTMPNPTLITGADPDRLCVLMPLRV